MFSSWEEKDNRKGSIKTVIIILFFLVFMFWITFYPMNNEEKVLDDTQWGGTSPIAVYQIFDKDTGVYYAVTEKGGICPMYTIEGEVKLVDQGNEYVVHKNLGEPYAQE